MKFLQTLFVATIAATVIYGTVIVRVVGYKSKTTNWLKTPDIEAISCGPDKNDKGKKFDEDRSVNMLCGDYEGIRIIEAFWGRNDTFTCQTAEKQSTLTHKKMCWPETYETLNRLMKHVCDNKQTCRVPLYFFDNEICPSVRKYIRVLYECRHLSGMKRSHINKMRNLRTKRQNRSKQ